jgi:cytochrome c
MATGILRAAGAMGLVLLAGCTTGTGTGAPMPSSMLVERGLDIAQLRCAACHAIDGSPDSPRANAPPFRQLRVRFNTLTWERAMTEISEGGHDEMPAVRLDSADIRDLKAYIETIR